MVMDLFILNILKHMKRIRHTPNYLYLDCVTFNYFILNKKREHTFDSENGVNDVIVKCIASVTKK